MSNAIKNEKYAKIMDNLKDEKVVFIIDECHRSQFGKMHQSINKYFNKAQYFGFTGTPRFIENKSSEGRVTADLFEKCIHSYLIKDAINDGNVLGFSVEYIKTFDGDFDEYDDEKVSAIDKEEVFMCDERIDLVANHIVKIHNSKTKNKAYTAIFAVESIPMLIKYYNAFKNINHNLKIAGIFTFGANEDLEEKEEHSRESLDFMIKDYNKMFDTNFSTDTFSSYFKDVSKKVKTAKIDILLVVKMFLTGFDSKTLNTLYVDKNLKYHDLLQAYSRTNRVEKSKKAYGNIVCYRNLKKNTDDALRLFSQTNNTDGMLMQSYEYYLDLWHKELSKLLQICKTPQEVDNLMSEEDKKRFVISFRELTKILNKLNTFVEFEFKEEKLSISEQTYQDYKSKYFTIYDSIQKQENEKTSILSDIDFSIELMHTDKVNISYIMNLIRDIDTENQERKAKEIKSIIKELDNASDEKLRLKVDLIKQFLNEVVINPEFKEDIDFAYEKFENEKKEKEIQYFSNEIGLKEDTIKTYISEYEYCGIINRQEIGKEVKITLKPKFNLQRRIIDNITNFIKNYVDKFSSKAYND